MIEPGSKLAHYEVLTAIGRGGMGEVWKARDSKLGREVAIKTLPVEFAGDPDRLARFEREAKLLASLNHPNIAGIYDLEEHEGTHFLVLELVEGDTLQEVIGRGAIPAEASLTLGLQIIAALEAAHEAGVIHRDLKPANIKVTPQGQVKVLDFGLAKAFGGDEASASHSYSPTLSMAATQQGVILGTAAYMSPEQAKGLSADKRADVFSFGCVLFEMLTGQHAFDGEMATEIMAAVIRSEPDYTTLQSDLHPDIKRLLRRCLEKDPVKRFRDIGDVRFEVEQVVAGAGGVRVEPSAQIVDTRLPSKLGWVAAFALGLVIAGFGVWMLKPDAPAVVSRFYHVLPDDQEFTNASQPVVAISPDTNQLVYVANSQLYLRSLNDLEGRPISGTEEGPVNPFFSPDGEWIGYVSTVDRQLKKIPVGGGSPVALADLNVQGYWGAHWYEDESIVFSTERTIMRVSANGGTPVPLIETPGEVLPTSPQILPGGKFMLLSLATNVDQAQVVAYSLDSGEQTVLFPGVYAKYVSTGHIVYIEDGGLSAVPFDPETLEVFGGGVGVVEGVQAAPQFPHYAVSNSGSLVFVSGDGSDSERILALVDRNGAVEPLDVPPKQYRSPRLSPDGQRLVVQSVEDSGGVIWVYDLAGNRAIEQLTFDGDNHRPSWTPDSERITFSSDLDGPMSLYSLPADGSGAVQRLTTAEEGTSHWMGSWTPDGQTLVFNVERDLLTDWDIWALSVGDDEPVILYDTPGRGYFGPELSPDGRWLAYGAGPIATALDIYVEPFPQTEAVRRISQAGGYWPLWSPDGSELYYRPASTSGEVELRSVNITAEPDFGFSNEQTFPVEGFAVVGFYKDYDMSPDGERLVLMFPADRVAAGRTRPQINVVLNWFEELKERVPVP